MWWTNNILKLIIARRESFQNRIVKVYVTSINNYRHTIIMNIMTLNSSYKMCFRLDSSLQWKNRWRYLHLMIKIQSVYPFLTYCPVFLLVYSNRLKCKTGSLNINNASVTAELKDWDGRNTGGRLHGCSAEERQESFLTVQALIWTYRFDPPKELFTNKALWNFNLFFSLFLYPLVY